MFDRIVEKPGPLVSITVDIAFHSPRTQPVCMAIIGKLLTCMEQAQHVDVVNKIKKKFQKFAYSAQFEIWLQKIAVPAGVNVSYTEDLCRVFEGALSTIWDSSWISSRDLKRIADNLDFSARYETLKSGSTVIDRDENKRFWKYRLLER